MPIRPKQGRRPAGRHRALPTPTNPPRSGRRATPVLELRDVSTHYGLVSVLRNVNVEIYPGEMVCLLGGNASGKTTTLKTILGYVKPTEGDVVLDGEVVTGLADDRRSSRRGSRWSRRTAGCSRT